MIAHSVIYGLIFLKRLILLPIIAVVILLILLKTLLEGGEFEINNTTIQL